MSRETISLGRVGFVNKGKYSPTVVYEEWDMVSSIGNSYVYINETEGMGIDVTNENYWQCIAQGSGHLGRYRWSYNEVDNSLELFYSE